MSIKDKYAIVGLGVTKQGKLPGISALSLEVQAVQLAIEDAGLKRGDIDGYIYQPTGSIADDFAPRHLGLEPKFFWGLQLGGATAVSMLHAAVGAIETGLANYVVCAYADNLYSRQSSIGGGGAATLSAFGMFGPASSHAMSARRHMQQYGTTSKQLGAVAVQEREYAAINPEAYFYGKPITIEDHQNSRMIVDPLHLMDICLITDGGAAVIVTSIEKARGLRRPPVYIMGIGQGNQLRQVHRQEQWTTLDVGRAKETAFGMAGIDIKDIDVAELYDCFTSTVIMELEGYGFCKKGEGGPFVEAGNLRLDGAIPTNTAGGELAWAYLQGFTPLVEGIRQMRGECGPRQVKDAEVCLVAGHGSIVTQTLTPVSCGHASLILRR